MNVSRETLNFDSEILNQFFNKPNKAMKNFLFLLLMSVVPFFAGAQIVSESEIKSDANPTYTVPDTVSASETLTFSKSTNGSRWNAAAVQVSIWKVGSTTIAGATVKVQAKIKETDPWADLVNAGTVTYTVTNGDQSVLFYLPHNHNFIRVTTTNGTSGVYKMKVTERRWKSN